MVRTTKLAAVVVIAVAMALGGTAAGASVDDGPPAAETTFVALLNADRLDHGLAPLTVNDELAGIARAWSAQMSAAGQLRHNPDYRHQYSGEWSRIGENVGYTRSSSSSNQERAARLHRAFMDSAGHRANVLGDYNQVGVGVVVDGPTMWVTLNFVQGPVPVVVETPADPPIPYVRQHFVRG